MSGIKIKIRAGSNKGESKVDVSGSTEHIIRDDKGEGIPFGIGSDRDLKRAVGKYFGREPNDAYLHSETPWGDLYRSFGWPQVKTIIFPKKAEILEIDTKPVIMSTKIFQNNSDKEATFTGNISEQVTDTVSTEWSSTYSISMEQTISYGVEFLGSGVKGETKFGFVGSWGKADSVSKTTTLSTESGISITLGPHESAEAQLSANSGRMRLRVTYEAYLTGSTAVNYDPTHKGHHFWGLSIGPIVEDKKVEITEDIEIGYYSNATVSVNDVKTRQMIMHYVAEHPNENKSK